MANGYATILQSPFFINAVLPFVLIFTVVFAILQKSEILGKGKKQIDAIVALVIGLIVISFANAVGIINSLMPFLAVGTVVILVLMIMVGLFHFDKEKGVFPQPVKIGLMVVVIIAVVVAVMIATGAWDYIKLNWFSGPGGGVIGTNIIFAIIIIAAIAVALWPMKGSEAK